MNKSIGMIIDIQPLGVLLATNRSIANTTKIIHPITLPQKYMSASDTWLLRINLTNKLLS